jgi:DNA-directed RNA polymerase II subunit RPB2
MGQIIRDEDLYCLIDSEVMKGENAHIKSSDFFYSVGMEQVIKEFKAAATIKNERDSTEEDRKIEQISFEVQFENISMDKPMITDYDTGKSMVLTPSYARKNGFNYSAALNVGFKVFARADYKDNSDPTKRIESEKDINIAHIPIIVGSTLCHMRDLTKFDKMQLEEDWLEEGGYCIIKGKEGTGLEWVIDMIESRPYNNPNVFYNLGQHEKEISRLEFLSKPGDGAENSSQIKVIHELSNNIYVIFSSPQYLADIKIPFFLIFYLLGMQNDKEIIENIIYQNINDTEFNYISYTMKSILAKAFIAKDDEFGEGFFIKNHDELTTKLADIVLKLSKSGAPGEKENLNLWMLVKTQILGTLDKNLFPHIGLTAESRHNKLRFLGHLIHKLLLVEMQIIPSTNRDSLRNKRINAAGRALIKTFKTQFNLAIIQPIKAQLIKEFKSTSFSNVLLKQSVKSAINGQELERNLIQAIITGNKDLTVRDKQVTNRLASEMLYRKNQLNYISTLRVIRTFNTTSSSQAVRSHEMRMVDGSYPGNYDPIPSAPTGDRVGMVKQQSIMSSITESTSSVLMKSIILEDPDPSIIKWNKVNPSMIYYQNLTKIMVNYDIIACCTNAYNFITRYREMRRGYAFVDGKYKYMGKPLINPLTTIFWDILTDEILFWCDADRIIRPILVVRNNTELDPVGCDIARQRGLPLYDPVTGENYHQFTLITHEDLNALRVGKKTITDLWHEGKIDYLSPDEIENCLVSKNLANLEQEKNNPLKLYSHCDIQVGILGYTTLTCPYASHNPPTRIIYQTNQVKQACGLNALNYQHRMDKHSFTQNYLQEPIIHTIINKYIYPNGMNAIVGIQAYSGYNQEDSIIYNKASSSRMQYSAIANHIYATKIEPEERLGYPDDKLTISIKKEANYSKLQPDGLPKLGQVIHKNDVIIGKYKSIPPTKDGHVYKDTSVIYYHDEEVIIGDIIKSKNQDNDDYVRIKLVGHRELNIGCKFSSRAGQKGEVGMGLNASDMPFAANGLVPDLIINPCCIPSRMTIGQLLEGLMGKICALFGNYSDGTIFSKEIGSLSNLGDTLEKLGFNRYGLEKLFCGFNGRWIDTEIFIAPTYYQLLQKFVIDDMYYVSSGPTCILTHQPLEGASKGGGLRIGEMETWVLASHGSSHALMEKFRDNSDGYDIYVCATCGKMPVVNEQKSLYRCNYCLHHKQQSRIFKTRSTWSTKLFIQEMESCNVGVTLGLEKFHTEIAL